MEASTTRAESQLEQDRQQVQARLGQHKNSAARRIRGVARALRSAADDLDRNNEVSISGYARQTADFAERFGTRLEGRQLSELRHDLERFCRERPLLAGAGAAVASFLAVRLLRITTQRDRAREPEEGV